MKILFPISLVVVLSCGRTLPAEGQAAAEREARQDSATIAAASRTGPVSIDGRLDEAAWNEASPAAGFVQGAPTEGGEPAMPTSVRVLYDADALYVGARMVDAGASPVADQLVRRDRDGQYDYFEVTLDPDRDRQTGYLFRLGASGVEYDAFLSEQSAVPSVDASWDAVWASAARIDSAGWTAELRIPLSQIRYESRREAQSWGVNFVRRRLASSSASYFSLESRTVEGRLSQWGTLEALRLEGGGRRIEIRPYVVSQLTARPAGAEDPLEQAAELVTRAGLDVSYGLGSSFTLDATINPDFGQVEVDPAVVNLTAFETFFPEKRPFFVRDAQLFDFPLAVAPGQLFFSRRIGRTPLGRPPAEAEFTDVPDRTTIVGAGKLTGRTPGGLSVGVLAARTAEETGVATVPGSPDVQEFVVEPGTEYVVGRIRRDLRNGASSVGALLTAVNRHLPSSGRLDHLPSLALSGGLDFEHQWGGPNDRRWSLNGSFAATRVEGATPAILDLQSNPQHFFQRPDAGNLSVDSTATSLSGRSWRVEVGRQSGEHWTGAVSLSEISPGFAPNDIGFNAANEDVTVSARAAYRDITPGPLFRSWSASGFWSRSWRHALLDGLFDGDAWRRELAQGLLFLSGRFELHNDWRMSATLGLEQEVLSDTKTRGGPLMIEPSDRSLSLALTTDPRRALSVGPKLEIATRGRGAGRRLRGAVDLVWRPSASWELRLGPQVSSITDAAQFVATAPDAGFAPTFGSRHLFAGLERVATSMVTRLDVTFSPDLSLELFAQPLISAADFVTFSQLARPESYALEPFVEGEADVGAGDVRCLGGDTCVAGGTRFVDFDGDHTPDFRFPDPDFNLRSMRANVVLRWEFRPGSTLFFVWQHDVSDRAGTGDLELGRDLEALFGAEATDSVILKANYFLDL